MTRASVSPPVVVSDGGGRHVEGRCGAVYCCEMFWVLTPVADLGVLTALLSHWGRMRGV